MRFACGRSAPIVGAPREVRDADLVEVAHEQRPAVGQRVRTGVLVAGAGVEVEEEEERRERGVELGERGARRRPRSASCRRRARRSRPVRSAARRSPRPTPAGARRRGTRAWPAPRSRRSRRASRGRPSGSIIPNGARIWRPTSGDVGDRPEVHRVDLVARLPARRADLRRRLRRGDRGHQLRVAAVALDAGDEDVRGHRDERGLERGALRGHLPRDVAVVEQRLVDRVLIGPSGQTARTTPVSAEQSTSTSVPSAGTPSANVGRHDARHLVLAARRCRCGSPACPRGRRPR